MPTDQAIYVFVSHEGASVTVGTRGVATPMYIFVESEKFSGF